MDINENQKRLLRLYMVTETAKIMKMSCKHGESFSGQIRRNVNGEVVVDFTFYWDGNNATLSIYDFSSESAIRKSFGLIRTFLKTGVFPIQRSSVAVEHE